MTTALLYFVGYHKLLAYRLCKVYRSPDQYKLSLSMVHSAS